jgi:hypothetical protein
MAHATHEPPAILVEVDPEWTFDRGFFKVHWCGQCWAYPPHQFFAMFARMGEVAREYRMAGAEVVPFPERVGADHAASS